MLRKLSVAVLLAATSSLTAQARQLPIDSFIQPIQADAKDAAALKAVCDREIAEIERRQRELETEKGPATQLRSLQRYDDIVNLITAASGESTLYRQVMADDARRQAGADCEVRVANATSKLSLSRPIYDRLKAIPTIGMSDATKLYLTRTLASFERSGVASDPAKRAQIQALQEELAKASTDFAANIAKGRKTVTADPADLEGLPADYLAAHKPGADGKVVISTDYPDINPVMAYAKSEALRKRLTLANLTRAYPENDVLLRRILDQRSRSRLCWDARISPRWCSKTRC